MSLIIDGLITISYVVVFNLRVSISKSLGVKILFITLFVSSNQFDDMTKKRTSLAKYFLLSFSKDKSRDF